MAHWTDQYVGTPYIVGEFDCANLVEQVLEEQFSVDSYFPKERDGESVLALSSQIDQLRDDYAEEINSVTEGCLILMRARKRLNHIGIGFLKNNEPYCLHNMRNVGMVCAHRVRDLHKLNLEVAGIYKLKHAGNSLT